MTHDEAKIEAMRATGLRVIFCKHMKAETVWREPTLSKPGAPVFVCRSPEDLQRCIDREFWRQMGIEDPRL